jgi:hypothetical protein
MAIFDNQLSSNRKKAKKNRKKFQKILHFLILWVNNYDKCAHYTTGDNSNEQNRYKIITKSL